ALDRAIQAAAAVKPGDAAAYQAARAQVIEAAAGNAAALAERGADARWTRDGWRQALVAEASRVRMTNPELTAHVDAPRGIDPEHYRRFRVPRPLCQHDLARLGRDAVPLVLERLLWTLDARPFSEGEAGKAERESLALATLFVPGQLGDARARFAMEDALRSAALPAAWRQQAAVSLGQCAGADAVATLISFADDPAQSLEVRQGAAWGLGRTMSAAAADALAGRLSKTADDDVRRALVNGLGLAGDKWAWEARGAAALEGAAALRRRCSAALVAELEAHPADRDLIGEKIAEVAAPEALAAVRKMAGDEGAAPEVREAARAILPVLEMSIAGN
ncbi:MAG TPA: HEAT repeat domain-containing protein, partial [Planctomycetota bacterium]|nr:HEAT repeat domain-containing protein [Planctomycetota bacterium]